MSAPQPPQSRGVPPGTGPARSGSVVLLALALLGCDRSAPAPPAAVPTVPPGPCVVTGTVHFAGTVPAPVTSDGECCPGVPRPADDTVVVNANGTLRNVIVYVKDGPNIAGPPPGKVVLAQVNCQYRPHVLALRVGQQVVVTSHDPTMHNVLVRPSDARNPSDNQSEYKNGSLAYTFVVPDDEVTFKCSVHAWMKAYGMVFAHPCYAVTGDDGTFNIAHLPPGTYTVVAHHERYGDLEQTVTVTAAKPTADAVFDYHP